MAEINDTRMNDCPLVKGESFLPFIESLATKAGDRLLELRRGFDSNQIEFKNERDLVTQADREIEAFIIDRIRKVYPDHSILGEETGHDDRSSDCCWVIDPIDGTTSFVHNMPFYSISIALQHKGKTIAAAVNGPKLGELFLAARESGAFLNGAPIRVSNTDALISSLLATGFACLRAQRIPNNLPNFNRIAPDVRGIRRMGSAALDLAYVAAGRMDGYWEIGVQEYDIAAGALMVQEAGGSVTDFIGGDDFPNAGIVATNGSIHSDLTGRLDSID